MILQYEPWFQREAVRPIPIDPMEIENAASTLWRELLDTLDAEYRQPSKILPLNGSLWPPNWGPKIKVKNVAGKQNTVPIIIHLRQAELVDLGDGRVAVARLKLEGFLQMTAPLVLAVVMNLGGLPSAMVREILEGNRSMLQEEFRSIISHELTHAKDFLTRPQYDMPQDDPVAYYNDPLEVRAFMQQVAREALQEVYALGGVELSSNERARKALAQAPTWKRINQFLSPENRKKMIQGVLTKLRDFGVGV